VLIEQIIADNECWPSAFLFVAGLWIKCDTDQVAFARYVSGGHLPCFLPDGATERFFLHLVTLWHARNHFGQVELWLGKLPNHDLLFADDDCDIIAHGDAGTLQQVFGKAKPLTVPPFLNFSHHASSRKTRISFV
jgi:hypothetical protein